MDQEHKNQLRKRLARFMEKEGKRNTRQRDVIVDCFFAQGGHITLQELTRRVQEGDPGIGFATVYRTMKLLTEANVAHERRFDEGQARYELADLDHHDHLICTNCGRIDEFEDEALEARQDAVVRELGWRLKHHRHELYGVCPACLAS
ncbi:MAG: Fur family transcriptional regulator [Myxococcota bacterium]|nr:Fur family transcriptional regulator [Myxococcota bacterium]